MKICNLRRAVASLVTAGGVLWAGAAVQAQLIVHSVGDPSFEQINLGALDYYYVQGPPNSPFWKDHGMSTGKNAVYNTLYSTDFIYEMPDPRTGDQAIDGEGAYNYQVLDDVFVAGRTYTYTMYTQGWEPIPATSDINDRLWLYLFAGVDGNDEDADLDDAPGDEGAPGTMDGDAILRATWHQNGVIDNIAGTGTGEYSFLPFTGFNRNAESAWTEVGLTYTATAADAGKRIGLGFWANELGSVDDVSLVSESASFLAGDYNGNDVIDAADYTTWRDAMTAVATDLLNDPTPGTVDETDFTYWRDHYGQTLGGGAGSRAATVPEPGGLVLAATALAGLLAAGPWRRLRTREPMNRPETIGSVKRCRCPELIRQPDSIESE